LTANQFYKIQINEVFDTAIAYLNWRYTTLNEIAYDFAFLSESVIHDTEASELEKHAVDLAKKYVSDLNGYKFSVEIKSFKYIASSISKDLTLASPLDLLQLLYDYSLITIISEFISCTKNFPHFASNYDKQQKKL
jgi:hypothetical protein